MDEKAHETGSHAIAFLILINSPRRETGGVFSVASGVRTGRASRVPPAGGTKLLSTVVVLKRAAPDFQDMP